MDRAVTGAVPHLQFAAAYQVIPCTGPGQHPGPGWIGRSTGDMFMAKHSEQQRRAIVRTAVALGLLALALFAFTVWRGVR